MLVIGLLMWFAQGGDSCAACSIVAEKVVLCEPHAAEERIVLAREGKRVGSSDEAAAIAGLEAIAALTRAHPGAPSPRVVAELAKGLSTKRSPKVRIRAAELLGPPQHASESLEALLHAFVQTDGQMEGIPDAEAAELILAQCALLEVVAGALEQMGLEKKERRKLAKATKELKESREKLARVTPLLEVRSALLRRLAGFPDDRVVQAILRSSARGSLESVETLLLLDSRSSVEHVLALLEAWQARSPVYEKKAVERHEARGRGLQESLTRLATRRGLVPCPAVSETPHDAWKEWWQKNRSAFREKLAGVTTARLDSTEGAQVPPR